MALSRGEVDEAVLFAKVKCLMMSVWLYIASLSCCHVWTSIALTHFIDAAF